MKPFLNRNSTDLLISVWLCSGAILALLGNAASDVWLTSVAVIFIVRSFILGDWAWTREPWVQMSGLFWIWILSVSTFSPWQSSNLGDAAAWIRFPIFAIGFATLFGQNPKISIDRLAIFTCFGLAIFIGALVIEKIGNPDAERLYGTWGQNIKAGWYLFGFGLPVSLWAIWKANTNWRTLLWGGPLVLCIVGAFLLAGDVYVTLSYLFGITIFLAFNGKHWRRTAMFGAAALVSIGCVFFFFPDTADRYVWSLRTRLPWMESSDYFVPWMRGLNAGLLQPFFGLGVGVYEEACNALPQISVLDVGDYRTLGCQNHPHQLYIQTFAETGTVGLLIFSLAVLLIVFNGVSFKRFFAQTEAQLAAFCLLVVAFWPISTYSDAFGQHRNFFTWFLAAWALALRYKSKSDGKA
ncbi:MAG: O-antigen ligase family protein [Rhodobacteraceae bacterium]|nr:O-antigen ligase family protein [Paracoccaceae bacterium]